MSDIIRLLPDAIANQIAAGEVVQRPASVVKELLENAIDAQSRSIVLRVKESGKTLVQVIDDGIGMSETDARMSFERHATSKIQKAEDLFNIRTMGFRGEALASIAAVAQVELKTKRAEDALGTHIIIEGSQLKSQQAVAALNGTTLSVKNLFFNVPARRNFLKSNPVEMRHIVDEFYRVALAHPDIEMQLFHNDLEVAHLTAGKLSHRIVSIFGKHYRKQLAPCQEETPVLKIKGYIGKPENAKKTRGEQFFFVNTRFVKHSYLHHAVVNAYEQLIPSDSHPFYVLFLEIDPSRIDINIHPTKTEVKFDDERTIYAILQAAVRKTLSVHHLTPALDFEGETALPSFEKLQKTIGENPLYPGTKGMPLAFSKTKSRGEWEQFYAGLQAQASPAPAQNPEGHLFLDSRINHEDAGSLSKDFTSHRPVFQLHQRYILSPVKSGVLLIDQIAAYERILYDRFLATAQNQTGSSQSLLFPIILSLSPVNFQLLLEIAPEIRNLGFVFDILENNAIRLVGIPTQMGFEEPEDMLEELLSQYQMETNSPATVDQQARLAQSLARRLSLRLAKYLTPSEMHQLIDQLFASINPNYTPGGQKIYRSLSLPDLAGLLSGFEEGI